MLSLGLEWQMCLVKRLLLALPAAGTLSVRRGRGHVGQQAHDKNAGNDATILQIIYASCLRDVPTLSERLKYWLICWHIMWLITR